MNSTINKKVFPSKYLKYLSYGLHVMKQIYVNEDEYKQKAAEFLHLNESKLIKTSDLNNTFNKSDRLYRIFNDIKSWK